MQQIITAKLKLIPTAEQSHALRQTQLAYRDALNAVSHYAFEQGKTGTVTRLHKGMYAQLRTRYGLPSQLACSVERQVAATYKGLWTKLLKNTQHRRAKITKKRFKGLDKPPHYSSPTVQYTYERDYTFQRDSRVSIGTLGGRVVISYQGYVEHIALIRHGASIGDAKLWYDKPKQTFYLLVSLEIGVPEPICEQFDEVVGVDVGIRYLAVTSTSTGKAGFYPGKRVRHTANHHARLRKRLQHKGTRGAKRRLRRIAQRERRLKLQANHIIAKQLIEQHPRTLIGLEHLTGIREHKRRRKRKRRKNGNGCERVSQKARHPPLACIRNGLLPNCKPSSVTRRRLPDRWRSRWMRITPHKPARCAATGQRRTAHRRGCCSCATTPSVTTGCMLIWLAQEM
jgi:putative transposase